MRLIKDSLTVEIIKTLWQYGQLPYSSFRMLHNDYEWAKDCVQKLIREEYIGVIKAVNLKSLYLKPTGQRAWLAYCERTGSPTDAADKPAIVYNADKARRAERINEVQLLADLAGFANRYISAPEAKRLLEQEAARQSDNIRYSRFAGLLFTEAGGLLVYHFGHGNLHLNISGEKSAVIAAGRLYKKFGGKQPYPRFSMLIIGNSSDTASQILNYSDMLAETEKDKRLLNRHFNFADFKKVFADILFLPIVGETPKLLRVLVAPGMGLREASQRFRQEGRHMVNLLECRLHLWKRDLERISNDMPVDFLCYEWQKSLVVEELAKKGVKMQVRFCCVDMGLARQLVGLEG